MNMTNELKTNETFFTDTINFLTKQISFCSFAALDQSGGSTPKALKLYGICNNSYTIGEESMFDKMHSFRSRIIKSPKFNGDRIIATILFENTLRRTINNKPTAQYLWDDLEIVPFLKIDEGLIPEHNGVQIMK